MELFRIGFFTITIIDIFDIAIVTLIIYWIYRALKNTIAVQILVGMVLIIVLSFITELINLKSLNWILRTISDIWLLAFIILFQPELRKLLLLITRSPIFRLFVKTKFTEVIDEITDAALEMAEKHTGALIVFTKNQNVQMTIESGITMNANVSKELLLSVFNTKSPLHDGAVIIENGIVLAARCVLPLSAITKVHGKNLGTRHRAALGLTEQVDAVVLIVSEETGWISIASGGEILINIAPNQLNGILRDKISSE